MKLHYYPETDNLYIELSDKHSVDSHEIEPGVILDFDDETNLVGIAIDQASRKLDLSKLDTYGVIEDIVDLRCMEDRIGELPLSLESVLAELKDAGRA
jgi:uncharacterized protein YuzE